MLRRRLFRGYRSYGVIRWKPEVENSTERHQEDTVGSSRVSQSYVCLVKLRVFVLFLIGVVLGL